MGDQYNSKNNLSEFNTCGVHCTCNLNYIKTLNSAATDPKRQRPRHILHPVFDLSQLSSMNKIRIILLPTCDNVVIVYGVLLLLTSLPLSLLFLLFTALVSLLFLLKLSEFSLFLP